MSVRHCRTCGGSLPGKYRSYCSRACRSEAMRQVKPFVVPTGTIGAIGELTVCADLMRRGWHVFRAQSPTCPCDLIAMRDGLLYRVEVRTAKLNADESAIYVSFTPDDVGRSDVLAAVLPDGDVHYTPDPFDANTRTLSLPRHVESKLGIAEPEELYIA